MFREPAWLKKEKRLLKRVRHGDRRAFSELYAVFAPLLYRSVLLPRLGDATAAEDALADTFIAALKGLAKFESRGTSIWFWLARIAANKAMDFHRHRDRTNKALANFERLLEPLQESEETPDIHGFHEHEKLRNRVQTILQTLNPRYRQAIEVRFLEGGSRAECAERLAVVPGTFDVLLLRALRSFRKAWEAMDLKNDEACNEQARRKSEV